MHLCNYTCIYQFNLFQSISRYDWRTYDLLLLIYLNNIIACIPSKAEMKVFVKKM